MPACMRPALASQQLCCRFTSWMTASSSRERFHSMRLLKRGFILYQAFQSWVLGAAGDCCDTCDSCVRAAKTLHSLWCPLSANRFASNCSSLLQFELIRGAFPSTI
eukprot:1151165-Pelagomonas_calceolata.AAC.7